MKTGRLDPDPVLYTVIVLYAQENQNQNQKKKKNFKKNWKAWPQSIFPKDGVTYPHK